MNDTRWQEIDDWFSGALDRPSGDREAYLAGCDDVEIRERVRRLLQAAERSDDLLRTGAARSWSLGAGREVDESLRRSFPAGRELLDRYRILGEVGSGGMGVVFRARDLKLERDVAVKVLVGGDLNRDRILREARAAASVNHPGLVGVYDVGEVDGTPFLVMELVDGPTLDDAPPATVDEAVEVGLEVCEALARLHGRGLVHRDVKPGNLLRVTGEDGRSVKLIDLGLARSRSEAAVTVEGRVLGTPAYMAPEQARAQQLDPRADLYAVGVMLYRWTTGRLPFEADDPLVLISQHVHAPVTAPRDLGTDVPPALEDVILRLLAKDPRDRFDSAERVAEALRDARRVDAAPDGGRALDASGSPLERGRRAIRAGEWTVAFESLRRAAAAGPLEGADLARLAAAAMWSGRYDDIVPALERAAAAYTAAGDPAGTAAMACELAEVLVERRSLALARGWLRRAEALLADLPEARPHAFAAWLRARFLVGGGDHEAAKREARRSIEIARRVGDRDFQALALIELGHIAMLEKRFDEGTAYLDDAGAMAMAGELGPFAAGTVLCGLIFAWRAQGNWSRAAEWTQAQSRWCDRENVAVFPGLCRIHRGELTRLRGDLEAAERDLEQGARDLIRIDAWGAGIGYRELGEARLRRGDLPGAEDAFRRALELGSDAQPGLARLRLLEGDAREALRGLRSAIADDTENYLDAENRGYMLPTLVAAALEVGDRDEAERAVVELERLAEASESSAYRAGALAARGDLLLADGDAAAAAVRLRSAVRRWSDLDAPYETAEVRARLGEALRREGDCRGARLQLAAALAVFERIGAVLDAERTRARIDELTGEPDVCDGSRPRAWAWVEVVSTDRLVDALGDAAWDEFEGWLQRTLGRCCASHGGTRNPEGVRGGFGAGFPRVEDAVRCAVDMQRALREHRARHGFAPPVRAGVIAREDDGLEGARRLAARGEAGDVLAAREVAVRGAWPWHPVAGDDETVRVAWHA